MSSFDQSDVFVDNPPANPVPVTVVSEFGTPVNVFGEVDVPYATETTIVSYTVPAGKTLNLTGAMCWGEYVGEVFIRVDGVQKGGGWTTAAQITLDVDFDGAPVVAVAAQVVTVSIIHYKTATRHFKANILGGTN